MIHYCFYSAAYDCVKYNIMLSCRRSGTFDSELMYFFVFNIYVEQQSNSSVNNIFKSTINFHNFQA